MSATKPTEALRTSANELIKQLDNACKDQGLATDILEASTRIKVFAPSGNPAFDELVTLRPEVDEVLMWYWSWGSPICPADEIDWAAAQIANVVGATRA